MWGAAALYARSLFASWSTQIKIFAFGALILLIGLLYFIGAGRAWLATRYGEISANLIVGGLFLGIGLIAIAVAKARGHKPDVSSNVVVAAAAASTAGRVALRTINVGRRINVKPILGSALAAATGAAILARQAVSRSAQSAVEILPPLQNEARTPERPSISGATADLASALGRAGTTAAHDAMDRWNSVAPKMRATATDLRRDALDGIADMISAAVTAILGRRRGGGVINWLSPRPSAAQRAGTLLSTVASDRSRLAQATTLLAFAALVVWLSKADRPSH